MPAYSKAHTTTQRALAITFLFALVAVAPAGIDISEEVIEQHKEKQREAEKAAARVAEEKLKLVKEWREAKEERKAAEKRVNALDMQIKTAQKTILQAKADMDEAAKKRETARSKKKKIENELEQLKQQYEKAKEKAKDARKQQSSTTPLDRAARLAQFGLEPRQDGFQRYPTPSFPSVDRMRVDNGDEGGAEEDMEEPGFWRKRALKKGAEPETAGEKKWVEQWKKEEAERKAAEKKAEQERIAAEKKAEQERIAAEKAEAARKAKEADMAEPGFFRKGALKKGAKPETTGEKRWLEQWEKEQAKQIAAEQAEAARKAKEEDMAEPGFFRKGQLKDGAEPETTGEKKWLAQWKKEQAAEAAAETKAEQERIAAEKKAEQERIAAEKAEAARKAKEEDMKEPGFFRKRELKDGAEPETTGEKQWLAQWKKEQAAQAAAETKAEQERIAAEKAEAARKAKEADMAEPGFFRKGQLKDGAEPETTGERQWLAAWKKEQQEAKADEREHQAELEKLLQKLSTDVKTLENRIDSKKMELVTAERELNEAQDKLETAQETHEDQQELLTQATRALPEAEAKLKDANSRVDSLKAQVDAKAERVAELKATAREHADKADMLARNLNRAIELKEDAVEARERYYQIKLKTSELQEKLDLHTQRAKYYKERIPEAKKRVHQLTLDVVEAREAYEHAVLKIYKTKDKAEKALGEYTVIEEADVEMSRMKRSEKQAQVDPFRKDIIMREKRLRQAEKEAVEMIRQADFHSYMVTVTKREIQRHKDAYEAAQKRYDAAVHAFSKFGELDDLDFSDYIHRRALEENTEAK